MTNAIIASTANMVISPCQSSCLRTYALQVEDHIERCASERRRAGHADDDEHVPSALVHDPVGVDDAEVGGDVADDLPDCPRCRTSRILNCFPGRSEERRVGKECRSRW